MTKTHAIAEYPCGDPDCETCAALDWQRREVERLDEQEEARRLTREEHDSED